MVFKIHNLTRTVDRFEEYREVVKCRASCSTVGGGEDRARSVADGNEMMRFYCLGDTAPGGTCVGGSDIWGFHGGKGAAAVCTFSGSGVAHESAGGGRGRRAMLVCRVIAGRVHKQLDYESLIDGGNRFDSLMGNTDVSSFQQVMEEENCQKKKLEEEVRLLRSQLAQLTIEANHI